MSPYNRYRRDVFSGLRNTVDRAIQIERGADIAVQYPAEILEDQKEEIAKLERGALKWYLPWLRAWFTPFPFTPVAFGRRVSLFVRNLDID